VVEEEQRVNHLMGALRLRQDLKKEHGSNTGHYTNNCCRQLLGVHYVLSTCLLHVRYVFAMCSLSVGEVCAMCALCVHQVFAT